MEVSPENKLGITRTIIVVNVTLALVFLVYLCGLDIVFVFLMSEQKSIVNDMALLIWVMPFMGALFTLIALPKSFSALFKILLVAASFLSLSIVGYFEFLWVATHFHSILGGRV